MNVRFRGLLVHTRRTTERIYLSETVTFLHGPVSTGKSTVARLIDFCLGGELERTPAIQQEFVAAELWLSLGDHDCTIERAADDTQSVRVTWSGPDDVSGSVNAPLRAQAGPLIDAEVYNLSDLIFHLCGVTPIKVRKSRYDPESSLIRLSIRDLWWYCYLEQVHLDSSFFRLEEPFRERKSQDAMRFFTGLHSDRLSQLEDDRMRITDEQRAKREAVRQIRAFMARFELGSELDMADQLQAAERALSEAERRRTGLEHARFAQTHPTDDLREHLRHLGADIGSMVQAVSDSQELIAEQKALRAELIMAKIRAKRAEQARIVFSGVRYEHCPECGKDLSRRPYDNEMCCLCGSAQSEDADGDSLELEALRRDLNERIDQIGDSIARRERELDRMLARLVKAKERKASLDRELQEELARYDSAFIESMRGAEREIATLIERISSLRRLEQMPQAINALEEEAGALQGRIDQLKTSAAEEQKRLRDADENILAIAAEFKRIMLSVGFPGVSQDDRTVIDPRNWRPVVIHGDQEWSFWDTGSGGKKTLFNVCYALAIHAVALERGLPVPNVLIIDSPTKNISKDENPELVGLLYAEIYRLARNHLRNGVQLVLIDADLVVPDTELPGFLERRMAGEPNAPSLIPYYEGP